MPATGNFYDTTPSQPSAPTRSDMRIRSLYSLKIKMIYPPFKATIGWLESHMSLETKPNLNFGSYYDN